MTIHDKVMWTEGMFLQPQHFQQHDRFIARTLESRLQGAFGYGRGFASLAIDEAALLQGKIAIASAQGILPDGTPFSIPSDDPAPPAFDVPGDARNEFVYLAVAMSRQGVAESDFEEASSSMPPRFHAVEVEVADSHAVSLRQAPLHVGRLNLRLMLARDANEGFSHLGLVRIVEKRSDGRVVIDAEYIEPSLHAPSNRVLDGYLREVLGMARQRSIALAARLAQPGRAGVGEIVDFLRLQICNRWEPQLAHLVRLPVLHPERLYQSLLALAGELATFSDMKRPPEYLPYNHDELAVCFAALMADLRKSFTDVIDPKVIPIELQERPNGYRVAMIKDLQLQRTAQFVIAANAQIPGEALRSKLVTQAKIGPVERIRDLVAFHLPGVPISPLPVAPREIPYHAGFNYFEIETRGSDLWRQLETSGGLAVHVTDGFPGLEMELWAIRP